jgi:hypothetical protein
MAWDHFNIQNDVATCKTRTQEVKCGSGNMTNFQLTKYENTFEINEKSWFRFSVKTAVSILFP